MLAVITPPLVALFATHLLATLLTPFLIPPPSPAALHTNAVPPAVTLSRSRGRQQKHRKSRKHRRFHVDILSFKTADEARFRRRK